MRERRQLVEKPFESRGFFAFRGFVKGQIPSRLAREVFAEFKRVLREFFLCGHIGPTSSHPDPPGRISPAAPMVLVRRGVRESRACPEYRDRRHIITGPLEQTRGFCRLWATGKVGRGTLCPCYFVALPCIFNNSSRSVKMEVGER